MNDVTNLRATIVARSDQINATDLIGIERILTVTDVRMSGAKDQPVIVHYEDDNGKPFKPGLTMRRVLILAWGEDGTKWIGKAMRVYADPTVKWGGEEVGGIRISHLTDITQAITVSLPISKGAKKLHTIHPLEVTRLNKVLDAIAAASTKAEMTAARNLASTLVKQLDIDKAAEAYNARLAALKKPTATAKTLDQYAAEVNAAADADASGLVLDMARGVLSAEHYDELVALHQKRFDQ